MEIDVKDHDHIMVNGAICISQNVSLYEQIFGIEYDPRKFRVEFSAGRVVIRTIMPSDDTTRTG